MESLAAAEDNYKVEEEDIAQSDQYEGLVYHKAKDNFDRSTQPGPGPNPVVKVPEFDMNTLKNNIQVIHT